MASEEEDAAAALAVEAGAGAEEDPQRAAEEGVAPNTDEGAPAASDVSPEPAADAPTDEPTDAPPDDAAGDEPADEDAADEPSAVEEAAEEGDAAADASAAPPTVAQQVASDADADADADAEEGAVQTAAADGPPVAAEVEAMEEGNAPAVAAATMVSESQPPLAPVQNEPTAPAEPTQTDATPNEPPLPWYRKYQMQIVVALLVVLVGVLAALLGVLLTQNNSNEGGDANKAVEPSPGSPPVDPPSTTAPSGPVPAIASTTASPALSSDKMPTNGPTFPSSPPTSARFAMAVERLRSLSGEEELASQGSPQHRAARWVSDLDPLQMDIDDPRFEQRYVLALFFYATGGDNWQNKQGWLTSQNECWWYGIAGISKGCSGQGVGGRAGCIAGSDGEEKICRIGMGRLNNLYGEIPRELGHLTEMRWFEVQDDSLTGTIPDSLGNWTKLHTFLVGGNYLHGEFPSSFEGNEMLGTIFVDRNQFNGTFPSVFPTLTNLEWLDAEWNSFVGELPAEMGELRSLRILNVNNNSLVGTLPDTWDNTSLLEDLEVAYNEFSGVLPASLGEAMFLKDLRASGNKLTGEIPESYYGLANLEGLHLDANQLVGELPQMPEPMFDGLQEFSIHTNGFSGRFPVEQFEDTLQLKVLSLHNNELTGTITSNICNRLSLSFMRLITLTADCDEIECNCCTCYLDGKPETSDSPPDGIESPTDRPAVADESVAMPTRAPFSPDPDRDVVGIQEQIETTVLQRGAVFDGMGEDDPRYRALDWILYQDQMQLTVDDSNLAQRYILALLAYSLDSSAWFVCGEQSNLFEGEDCEVRYASQPEVESHKRWLSNADECGWYGAICSSDGVVRGLELNNNGLIGELPPEITQLASLELISLPLNCLYGTMPQELGSMNELLSLELHMNGLSGAIPEEMYRMTQLQLLNVAQQFQYSFECQRSNGEVVNVLYKGGDASNGYNYGLVGDILNPDVAQWPNLKGLHVFDNSFVGSIAEEIGGLEELAFLRAHNNAFELEIPRSITRLSNLRELMLGKNQLWSDLPPDMGLMESLEILWVNENEMYGTLPGSLYDLSKLKHLWLQDTVKCEEVDFQWQCRVDSDSGFDGTIQTEIGDLRGLEWLLLKSNPFSGTLPTELGLCENLSMLQIHRTNIGGTVPEEVCALREKKLDDPGFGVGLGPVFYAELVFYADCRSSNATEPPFIQCGCCTNCCDHTTRVCIADD